MGASPIFPLPRDDHAVVLLHGLSSTPAELRYLSRALAKEGLTTHAPTLDGYSAGTGHAPMEQWIDTALAEFDALAAQHEHVSVCGLSMGATLAAAVAQQRPNVRALLVLSITFNYDGWAMPWYRFLVNALKHTPWRLRARYRERALWPAQ